MHVLTPPQASALSAGLSSSTPLVLIVDDEPCIAEYLALVLSENGYRTVRAQSLADVAQVTQVEMPQLALVDVALGQESGVVVARYLGEHLPEIGILFVSGYSSDSIYFEGLPHNVRTGFLQKVFTPAQLLQALEKLRTVPA